MTNFLLQPVGSIQNGDVVGFLQVMEKEEDDDKDFVEMMIWAYGLEFWQWEKILSLDIKRERHKDKRREDEERRGKDSAGQEMHRGKQKRKGFCYNYSAATSTTDYYPYKFELDDGTNSGRLSNGSCYITKVTKVIV